MGIKLSNNAFATLAAGINSSVTSITVTSGQGARFPTLSAGDYFYATLIDTSNNLEIVKCTARATDVLTVVRAQESTTARAYSTGDRIEIRITAQTFVDAAMPTPTAVSDQLNSSTGYFDLPAGTTAQRPGSPVAGMQRYNTSFGQIEFYNGSAWIQASSSGNPAVTYTATYLIVAGGGAGGDGRGGGGGAGGYQTGSTSITQGLTYQVVVGAGGAPAGGSSTRGGKGTDSSALGLISYGGGGGGGDSQQESGGGGGGSGGGCPSTYNQMNGSSYLGQGFQGGWSYGGGPAYPGSGGGGSYNGGYYVMTGGGAGTAGAGGGNGTANSITGSAIVYAGGGAGGTYTATVTTTMGVGGTGGGGNGGYGTGGAGSGTVPTAGGTNLGGGGGGGVNGAGFAYTGGAGGSGVVILSVPTASYTGTTTGSPTVTTNGSNTVIKFTSSGSYTA
jgi:hypothetical protein